MSAANLSRARCVQISEADLHSVFCEEMKKDNLLLFAKKTTEETRGVLPEAARVGPHGTGAFLLGYVLQIWARAELPAIDRRRYSTLATSYYISLQKVFHSNLVFKASTANVTFRPPCKLSDVCRTASWNDLVRRCGFYLSRTKRTHMRALQNTPLFLKVGRRPAY